MFIEKKKFPEYEKFQQVKLIKSVGRKAINETLRNFCPSTSSPLIKIRAVPGDNCPAPNSLGYIFPQQLISPRKSTG